MTFVTNSSKDVISLSSIVYPDRSESYTVLEDSLNELLVVRKVDSMVSRAPIHLMDSMRNAYLKRVQNKLKSISNERISYDLRRKRYKENIEFEMILISSFGVVLIAYMQMRLKTYESNLESFKVKIDNKSKLKKLLRVITSTNSYSKKAIPEYLLQHFIKNLFYGSNDAKVSYELHDAIELGKKLEITDLERIIVLKLSEKNLIEEESGLRDDSDETYYSINL